jgi:hypothetical protein
VFWIDIKFNEHLGALQGKLDVLSHHSYFTPKEGNAIYEQQGDIILKLEYVLLQTLLVIFNDPTFLC